MEKKKDILLDIVNIKLLQDQGYLGEFDEIKTTIHNIAFNFYRIPGKANNPDLKHNLRMIDTEPLIFTYYHPEGKKNTGTMLNPYPTKMNGYKKRFSNETGSIDEKTFKILKEIERYLAELSIYDIYCIVIRPPKLHKKKKFIPFEDVIYPNAPKWLKVFKVTENRCRRIIFSQVLDDVEFDPEIFITDLEYIENQRKLEIINDKNNAPAVKEHEEYENMIANIKEQFRDVRGSTLKENYMTRNSKQYKDLMEKYITLYHYHIRQINTINKKIEDVVGKPLRLDKVKQPLLKLLDSLDEEALISKFNTRLREPRGKKVFNEAVNEFIHTIDKTKVKPSIMNKISPIGNAIFREKGGKTSYIKRILPSLISIKENFLKQNPDMNMTDIMKEIDMLSKTEDQNLPKVKKIYCSKGALIDFLYKANHVENVLIWNILHPDNRIEDECKSKATTLFRKLNTYNVWEFLDYLPKHKIDLKG